MNDVVRILFFQTWWSWSRPANVPFEFNDYACRVYNFVEAAAWFVFAGLVLRAAPREPMRQRMRM